MAQDRSIPASAATAGADTGWTDRSGLRLVDYPRPSLAVDVALLTVTSREGSPRSLDVLLYERPADDRVDERWHWALPGTFVRERERLAAAAARALRVKCGITRIRARQLRVFDDPDRDPRGWVMSVAHVAVVPEDRLADVVGSRADLRLLPVSDVPRLRPHLPFDHREIVTAAVADIRARYAEHPDPERLLTGAFTLLELRRLHETILGEPLQKDTFRRHMAGRLVPTGDVARQTVGRPAELYSRAKHMDR